MNYLLGSFILERRKELGLSQKDIAEHLNVSIPTVYLWEKNERLPDLSLLGGLANILKVDIESLINCKINLINNIDNENSFDINQFSKNFTMLRKLSNHSLSSLSELLNVRYQKISKWENGESLPSINELKACAKIFNVTVQELYYGKSFNIEINEIEKVDTIIVEKKNKTQTSFNLFFTLSLIIVSILLVFIFKNGSASMNSSSSSKKSSNSSNSIVISNSTSSSSSEFSTNNTSSNNNSSSSNISLSSNSSSSSIISSTISSSSLTQEYIDDLNAFEQIEVNFYSYYTSLYVNIIAHSLEYDETKRFEVLVYLGDELIVNSQVINDDLICDLKLGKNYTIKLKYGVATKTYYTDYRITYTAIPENGICVELIDDYLSVASLYYSGNKIITIPETYEGYKVKILSSNLSNNTDSSDVEKISIPSSIEVIEENAFINFCNLKEIRYYGTKEEWNKIMFENEYSNPLFNDAILITNDDIPSISNELADEEYQNLGGDSVLNELLISKTSIAVYGDYTLDNKIINIELYDEDNLLCSSNTIDVIFINLKSNHKYKIIITFDGMDYKYTKVITTLA